MNCFMVVCTTVSDDLPISLHPTREEADAVARSIDTVDDRVDARVARVFDLLARDASEWVCTRVIEFRDGIPVADDVIRDFSEE